jgi:hypothetical protein
VRSRDGRPLTREDLPSHPNQFFDEWRAVTVPFTIEWNSAWGRHLRRELRRLGWRLERVEYWRVSWQ